MKLSDYAGELHVSANDAIDFVKAWFKPTDKIAISGLRSERTGGMDALAQSMTAEEFVETTTDESLQALVFDEDGHRWNIYVSCSPIKADVSLRQRGTKSNVDYVPGVWADIDVQSGGFTSQEDILSWMKTLELEPTIVCSSGSSGVHAYWRLKWNEVGDEKLVDSWWSYLDEQAGERSIDKLVDSTRILRLPGTLRFPKKEDKKSNKIGSVRLLALNDDEEHRYSVSTIRSVSAAAMAVKAEIRKKTITKDAQRRMDVDEYTRNVLATTGSTNYALWQAIASLEDYVNDNWDWARILEPYGWTYRRTLSDGSKEWARPGQRDRSAVVDYDKSPVMSLLSMSPATGLSDLKDAGIPLTRYRVLLRLHYNDDEEQMVTDLIREMYPNMQLPTKQKENNDTNL